MTERNVWFATLDEIADHMDELIKKISGNLALKNYLITQVLYFKKDNYR